MWPRIILVGKGGAGKDFLRQKLETRGFRYQISYTTRPPRPNETHGKDYYFMKEAEVKEMEKRDEWLHLVRFNNWSYGTTKAQFHAKDKPNVFIMTPSAMKQIPAHDRKESLVVFLNPPANVILERLKKRDQAAAGCGDSIQRRVEADNEQFLNFNDYDLMITNPDF